MSAAKARHSNTGGMSWVANVILVADMEDRDLVPDLVRWLEEDAPWNTESVPPGRTGVGSLIDQTQTQVNTWGGWKAPECHVWAGALNYADLGAVVAQVGAVPWKHPGSVQLLIMDQEESYFRLWMMRDGGMRQFAPEPPGDDPWVS